MNKVRWEEIMAVSARLFREKGFRATTMDDIASELYVTKPALYYYINTKHDLLYEICESAINRLMEGVEAIRDSEAEPEQKLRELIKWHVKMFATDGDTLNVYLADESELPAEKRDCIRGRSREYEIIYRDIFDELIEEKKFRELDVPTVVRAVSGMCNWLSNWYRPEGSMSTDQIAEVFLDLIIKGCLDPAGAVARGGAGKKQAGDGRQKAAGKPKQAASGSKTAGTKKPAPR